MAPPFRPLCSSACNFRDYGNESMSDMCSKLARWYCPKDRAFRCGTHAPHGVCSVCGSPEATSWDEAPIEEFSR